MEKKMKPEQQQQLLKTLKTRFEKNMNRHKELKWAGIEEKLLANPQKLWSVGEMERTGGEPDVAGYDAHKNVYIFYDCSAETPKGRRSLCYDREAQDSRKENAPEYNAVEMASDMGIELLTEDEYRALQKVGPFDTKTSSWIKTPPDIRKAGGAVFCDFRYGHVFLYHNGASSYYANRGFRGLIEI